MNITKCYSLITKYNSTSRCYHVSKTLLLDQKWREAKGLPRNPNAYGILTDSADYSYLDGRPTPYGMNQKKRIIKQKELAKTIIALTKEVDFAVERHQKLVEEKLADEKKIIDSKLKPKGKELFFKSKINNNTTV